MAKGQMAGAAKMFTKLDVTAEGNDFHVSMAMTQQQLQTLIAQVGGMLGGMLSGAGGGPAGP
jgi:hypothetical protein